MFPWLRPLHIFAECRCVLLHLDLGQCAIFYRKTMHNARRLALCPCVSSATTAAAAAKNRRWLDGIENQWQEQHNWAFSNLYTNLQSITNKLKSKQATCMHMHNVHTHTATEPYAFLFCFSPATSLSVPGHCSFRTCRQMHFATAKDAICSIERLTLERYRKHFRCTITLRRPCQGCRDRKFAATKHTTESRKIIFTPWSWDCLRFNYFTKFSTRLLCNWLRLYALRSTLRRMHCAISTLKCFNFFRALVIVFSFALFLFNLLGSKALISLLAFEWEILLFYAHPNLWIHFPLSFSRWTYGLPHYRWQQSISH